MDRFWNKVDKSGKCWLWTGARFPNGYGKIVIGGKHKKAHRVSIELDHRDPSGKIVMHTCDNPACVNPKHLVVGTHAMNQADKKAKGRAARGEKNGRAKLRDRERVEIAALYNTGNFTQTALAKRFNVSQVRVSQIVRDGG